MRKIKVSTIKKAVEQLCVKANFDLRPDVRSALRRAIPKEVNGRARQILRAIVENSRLAKKNRLAICQDTGLPVVFVDVGQKVNIAGGNLQSAVQQAVVSAYRKFSLRDSIIADPLLRKKAGFGPAVVHTGIIPGDRIRITVLPKGFGCENKSQLRMLLPTASIEEIKEFIIGTVKQAGPDACPPFVVGVGIGGTADYAVLLAKKALLKKVTGHKSQVTSKVYKLEREILGEINRLNIGPMGLGGKTTALAVNIETYPTHIAGLPVAINISCHALRSAGKII